MAFDASREPQSERQPAPAFQDVPIDWIDWGMRIVVFGGFLILYVVWVWHLFRPVVAAH